MIYQRDFIERTVAARQAASVPTATRGETQYRTFIHRRFTTGFGLTWNVLTHEDGTTTATTSDGRVAEAGTIRHLLAEAIRVNSLPEFCHHGSHRLDDEGTCK